ncbi:MAG: HD domain-containing protein [Thermoplasmatota archaeon]
MSDKKFNKRIIEDIESEIYKESIPNYDKIGSLIIEVLKESDDPADFFRLGIDAGILEKILPELARLKGIPAGPVEYHREDSFEHSMMVLEEMYKIRGNDIKALLMALFHDLGKGETPKEKLPKHYDHGERGVDLAEKIADRFHWKEDYKEAMKAGCREHMRILNLNRMQPQKIISAVEDMKETDIEDIVSLILDLVTADERGRIASKPSKDFDRKEIKEIIKKTKQVIEDIDIKTVLQEKQQNIKGGMEVGDVINKKRAEEMKKRL